MNYENQFLEFLEKIQTGETLLDSVNFPSKLSMRLDNGERVSYIKKGSGENVIILVHGNMSSSLHYSPLLDRLPSDFTAYAPDLRGFGDSTYYRPIERLMDFADDLYLFVKRLGLKEFTLAGWSTGGGVCLNFDVKYPGLCKNIVLIDSVATNGYAVFQRDIYGREIPSLPYVSKEAMMCDPYQATLMYNILSQNYAFMNVLWMTRIYTVSAPPMLDNYIYLTESLKQRNIIDVEWALATFNMTSKRNAYVKGDSSIDRVAVPVLCIRGSDDVVVTKEMFDLTINSIGENAESVLFSNCGHSPLVDCPDALAREVFGFSGTDSCSAST